MLKKDVLIIFSGAEVAEIINRHRSQVTRMPNVIPGEYQGTLLKAAKRKLRLGRNALERLERCSQKTNTKS